MYLSWASRSSWICRGCPVICSWIFCGPEDKPPKQFQWPLTLRSAFGDFWCTFPCESADFQSFQVLQKLFGLWFCENRDFSPRVSWLFHGDTSNLNLFISSLKLSVCPLNNGWMVGEYLGFFPPIFRWVYIAVFSSGKVYYKSKSCPPRHFIQLYGCFRK